MNKLKYLYFKKRIFKIIQIGNKGDIPSKIFDYSLVLVILLNISVMIIDSFSISEAFHHTLGIIEILTVIFFLIEYILRIWTASLLYPANGKFTAVLHFLVSFDGIVDLLSILPMSFLSGMSAFRLLRVVRIFHLFKVNTTYDSFNVIQTVLFRKRKQILSCVFIILMLMLASSLCMYTVEHEAQPEVFKNAFSGLWWSVSTILTVGYGDIYPVTVVGKMMAILIAILGVGVIALPTGIITSGFVEQYTKLETAGIMGAVTETRNLLKEASVASSEHAQPQAPILPPGENLCERLLKDRAATDPETRKLFDQYLAELLRDQ